MSFNNDEDGDGLAALFGGITPQGAPGAEPGPRRAAREPAATPESAPAPTPATPQYPGLAPAPYVAPHVAPATPAPASPAPASPAPASPAYEMPAPAQPPLAPPAQTQPFSPATPAYEMPAPAAPPQYPGLAPAPGSPYPAAQPPGATTSPPANPTAPPGSTQYPGLAPATPAYPPTAQYPAGVDPTAAGAPTPTPAAYPSPGYEPPAHQPPLYQPPAYQPPDSQTAAFDPPPYDPASRADDPARSVPEPIVEPPAFAGFEALGLATSSSGAPDGQRYSPGLGGGGAPSIEPRAGATPVAAPTPELPLVRAEAAPLATVFPPGPLLPESRAIVESPEELGRATLLEKIGLVIAVIAGPIGLVVAIVNAARGVRRRGWLIGIGRASLVLAVLSTILAGIGGYALWNLRLDQLQHDEIAAASAEFCAAGASDPAIVTAPDLGWPSPGATITESLALMAAWTDNWAALSATSPAGLREGLDLLAARGQAIIDSVSGSRIVDDATNEQQIASIEGQSGVAGWYTTYCVQP